MSKQSVYFSVIALSLVAACGGSTPPAEAPTTDTSSPPPATGAPAEPSTSAVGPTTFADQVRLGGQLYGQYCAQCHGGSGEGKAAPRVVGLDKGALPLDPAASAKVRKNQFKTVSDFASFVVGNMPPKAPGSLKTEEYWAILAFDLKANGIDLGARKLDAELAETLDVPRK